MITSKFESLKMQRPCSQSWCRKAHNFRLYDLPLLRYCQSALKLVMSEINASKMSIHSLFENVVFKSLSSVQVLVSLTTRTCFSFALTHASTSITEDTNIFLHFTCSPYRFYFVTFSFFSNFPIRMCWCFPLWYIQVLRRSCMKR